MNKRTISASWLKGLCDMFAAEGLDVGAMLQVLGLHRQDLEIPERRFPADYTSQLWELAVGRFAYPNLGLKRALCDRYGGMHMVGYAMMSSPTLLDGLQLLQRYLAVVSEAATFALEQVETGYWLHLGLAGEQRAVCRQRVEFGMLTLLMMCGWFARRNVEPLAVELVFDTPAQDTVYSAAFLCKVNFQQAQNRMLISHADLSAMLPTHNLVVADLHQQLLQQHLTALGHTSTRYRVLTEIVRSLKGGEPRRADIAASIHISDRTLQRRLKEENVSFQQLLQEARRELAQQYLADQRLSLAEISDLLGFEEQSNFFRACKRWFNASPAQHRHSLMRQP